jgi:2-polyprenyl-3-methyl-5-hydroxy-6-metoxy-1,4-benzoquinol methylase
MAKKACESWTPLGQALQDYMAGDVTAEITVHCDRAADEALAAGHFFRTPSEMPALERQAIDLCRGRVLDIGAGAGAHSLVLQRRGLDVTAIDGCPQAVEVMRQRGVANANCLSYKDLKEGGFDTLLMLMNGIGVVGSLSGLLRFLRQARRLVVPGGQVVLDSVNPLGRRTAAERARRGIRIISGRTYPGELHFRMEYRGLLGAPFAWLFVDEQTLFALAAPEGWKCRIAGRGRRGQYLAVLE